MHPEAKAEFSSRADKNGLIGWIELKDFLDKNVKIQFKFDGFDKIVCKLLVRADANAKFILQLFLNLSDCKLLK